MALTDDKIPDLINGTLKELGRLRFNQVAQARTRYEVFGRLMKLNKVEIHDGEGIQRNLMMRHSGAAQRAGMNSVDNVSIGDVSAQMSIEWKHVFSYYAYERRELLMNRGASRVFDVMKMRRTDGMLSLVELMEQDFFSKPADSSDELTPNGLDYWVVSNATTGFNGGNPSGFSDCGGIDSDTEANWKNFTGTYAAFSKADLIKLMRQAHRRTDFVSPLDIPDYREGAGQEYRIYLNRTSIENLEDLGEAQNENLGRDLAPMDGAMAFKRNPIIYVPQLDDSTSNPIYMLNFNYLHMACLKGDYLRESNPEKAPFQHNSWCVFIDLTYNYFCTDRRRQAVLTQ